MSGMVLCIFWLFPKLTLLNSHKFLHIVSIQVLKRHRFSDIVSIQGHEMTIRESIPEEG